MKVIAISAIKFNGKIYQKGEEVPGLTESDIAQLVAANSARVEGGTVAPEKPVDPRTVKADKKLEEDGTNEVANLPITMTMKKTQLIGIARANGLTVEKTATPAEVYKMIKEYREKKGIVVGKESKKSDNPVTEGAEAGEGEQGATPANATPGAGLPVDDGKKGNGDNTVKEPTPPSK